MNVVFRKNSWHSKIYNYTYRRAACYQENNLCNYFWKVVAAILFIPLTAFSNVLDLPCDSSWGRWLGGFMFYTISFLLTGLGYALLLDFNISGNWLYLSFFVGAGFILFWVSVLGGAIIGIEKGNEKLKEWKGRPREKKKQESGLFLAKIRAAKSKVCPLITWKA